MIPDFQVAEVLRLLGLGLSDREIHRRTGVSRASVALIRIGEIGPTRQAQRAEAAGTGSPASVGTCARCGRRIELPCRACQAESAGARVFRPTTDAPLELDLAPAEQRRLDELRRSKRIQDADARAG